MTERNLDSVPSAAGASGRPKQRSQRHHLASTLGTTFGVQALGFISGVVVARMLGVGGRGVLAAIVLWPAMIANLGDLGGPVGVVFESATKPTRRRELVGNSLLLTLVQSCFLVAIGLPLVGFLLLAKYHEYVVVGLLLLAIFIPLNLTSRYLNAISQGAAQFGRFNAVRIVVQVVYTAGVLVLFVAHAGSVRNVVLAVVASNLAVTSLVLWQYRGSLHPLEMSRPLLRETAAYGLRAHVGNLTPVDSMQLDLAVVVVLLSSHDAGLYAVAISAANVVRAQGTAIGMVAMPAVAGAIGDAKRRVVADIFRISLLLNLVTASIIAASATVLVPLVYGRGFVKAAPVVEVLALGMAAASMRQVLGDCLRGLGRPGAATVGEIVSWVVAAVGLVALVPLFGVFGAACAVSLSYASALAVAVVFARRCQVSVAQLFVPRARDLRTLRSAVNIPWNRHLSRRLRHD